MNADVLFGEDRDAVGSQESRKRQLDAQQRGLCRIAENILGTYSFTEINIIRPPNFAL